MTDLLNNNNSNNNNKGAMKMDILNNGGNAQVNANQLFEAFLTGGIAVKAILPVGEHKATFEGLDIDPAKMIFTIQFSIDTKIYEHRIQFKPEKAEQITWTFQALARQLEMEGNVSFAQYNEHKYKPITVWAVKVEGYAGVFYNYNAPKATTIIATATEVSDGTDF